MSGMAAMLVTLLLSGCALARFSETREGQPVYVLSNPTCILGCASDTGTVRGENTTGDLSLQQQASTTTGGALAK